MNITIYASVQTRTPCLKTERVKISLTEKPRGNWWKCENPENPEEWFIAPFEDLKNIEPVFVLTDQANDPRGRTVEHLVYQALYLHHLDPARVLRAVNIMAQPELIVDKFTHFEIKSDPKKPAYIVTRGSCTCEDHKRNHASGQVCKHRIAAGWTRIQSAPRNRVFTFQYCLDCMTDHWLEDGELCHGETYDPRLHIQNATFKIYNFTSSRYPAEIEVIPLNLHAALEAAKV
jgi:hypothetical protein